MPRPASMFEPLPKEGALSYSADPGELRVPQGSESTPSSAAPAETSFPPVPSQKVFAAEPRQAQTRLIAPEGSSIPARDLPPRPESVTSGGPTVTDHSATSQPDMVIPRPTLLTQPEATPVSYPPLVPTLQPEHVPPPVAHTSPTEVDLVRPAASTVPDPVFLQSSPDKESGVKAAITHVIRRDPVEPSPTAVMPAQVLTPSVTLPVAKPRVQSAAPPAMEPRAQFAAQPAVKPRVQPAPTAPSPTGASESELVQVQPLLPLAESAQETIGAERPYPFTSVIAFPAAIIAKPQVAHARDVEREPARLIPSPAAPESAPSIQVTIGRIEIRATPPPPSNTQPRPGPPILTLDEYLRQRNGGDRP
jgi:hypothetical protein